MKNSGTIRVGIGGWVFPPWRGAFYPPGLRQAEELAYASRHVTAIEINGTFYRIQTPASFKKWCDETPDDFVFSLKGAAFPCASRRTGDGADPIWRDSSPAASSISATSSARSCGNSRRAKHSTKPIWRRSSSSCRARSAAEGSATSSRRGTQFRMPGIHRPLARARRRARPGRRCALPGIRRNDCRFRLSPAAPLRRSRTRRLLTRRARSLGRAPRRVGQRKAATVFLYFINGAKIRAPAAAQALIRRL